MNVWAWILVIGGVLLVALTIYIGLQGRRMGHVHEQMRPVAHRKGKQR